VRARVRVRVRVQVWIRVRVRARPDNYAGFLAKLLKVRVEGEG